MNRLMLAVAAAISLYAGSAAAQMPAMQRAEGTVAAVSDKALTLTAKDGSKATVDLLPDVTVTVAEPIAIDRIQAGSYVATANKTQPDGSGVSVEIRVFPPDTKRFDVNRAMDDAGTMMTNGVVATAVSTQGGRRLTVDYGSGTRQITVPEGIPTTLNTPGTLDMVKPGLQVSVYTLPASGDHPARQGIRIMKGS